MSGQAPDALKAAIAMDLRPVRPLPAPIVRTIWVAPWALALLVLSVIVFGLRQDAPALGPLLTWGASGLEMVLGLILVAAALREAVPGTTLSRRALAGIVGAAAAAVVAITWLTWTISGTVVPSRASVFVWRICVVGTIVSAFPVLAVSAWLAARAYPLRPRITGALYGLGAGLIADAGWRLFCHFSNPAHVFGAHTLAIGAIALLGVRFATVLARRT